MVIIVVSTLYHYVDDKLLHQTILLGLLHLSVKHEITISAMTRLFHGSTVQKQPALGDAQVREPLNMNLTNF